MKKIIFTIGMAIMVGTTIQAQNQQDSPSATLPNKEGTEAGLYTLQQCKQEALKNNIAIRKADNSIRSAEEQRKEAYTNYFPNVSASGAYFHANKSMVDGTINPAEYIPAELATMIPVEIAGMIGSPIPFSMMKHGTLGTVTALQSVFAGGQIVNGNKLAKVGVEATQLQRQLSAREVELTTERYFWQLVQLREKIKTLDAASKSLESIEKDVKVAIKAGVALNNDLLQVQLHQNELASNRVQLENGIRISKRVLAQYIGVPYSESFDIQVPDIDASKLQQTPLPSLREEELGLSLLPEYQLLEKNVQVNQLQQKMEFGKNLPTVAVGAGYIYNDLMDKSVNRGLLLAQVSIPISQWWGGSHAVKRKKMAVQQAQEELENNRELLLINMQAKWDNLDAAKKQLAIARKSIEQADENLRIQTNSYKAGTLTMSDLLQAQTQSQQARDRFTEAYTDCQIKALEYRQATGQK